MLRSTVAVGIGVLVVVEVGVMVVVGVSILVEERSEALNLEWKNVNLRTARITLE